MKIIKSIVPKLVSPEQDVHEIRIMFNPYYADKEPTVLVNHIKEDLELAHLVAAAPLMYKAIKAAILELTKLHQDSALSKDSRIFEQILNLSESIETVDKL
jgi:hypothetical protein